MIVRDGIEALWQLHLAAANAYIQENKAAAAINETTDAAGRERMQGNGRA